MRYKLHIIFFVIWQLSSLNLFTQNPTSILASSGGTISNGSTIEYEIGDVVQFVLFGFICPIDDGPYSFGINAPGNDLAQDDVNMFTISFNTCGTYQVTAVRPCQSNTPSTFTIVVTGPELDPPTAGPDASVCYNQSTNITASGCVDAKTVWYRDACGSNKIGEGENINTGNLTETTDFYVRCENDCDTSDCEKITVTVLPPLDADFTLDDFCGSSSLVAYDLGTTGIFSFDNNPNGATINSQTGQITNATPPATYSVLFTTDDACPKTKIIDVAALEEIDASFTIQDFCEDATNNIVTEEPGGIFSFSTSPTDGASINSNTGLISDHTAGSTYLVKYEFLGDCPTSEINSVSVSEIVDPTFDIADFCFGSDNEVIFASATSIDGTFSITSFSEPGATINANTGELSNVTASAIYTVEFVTDDACERTFSDEVTVLFQPNADFTIDDFCASSVNTVSTFDDGGVFSFETPPIDAATIDANSGEIANATPSSTYNVMYSFSGDCPASSVEEVSTLLEQDATFNIADFCFTNEESSAADNQLGTFTFYPVHPHPDGALIDENTGVISNVNSGIIYQVIQNVGEDCPTSFIDDILVIDEPNANFTIANNCVGDIEIPVVEQGGGTFSFATAPLDMATINPATGELSNINQNTTYEITYSFNQPCAASQTNELVVYAQPQANFSIENLCLGQISNFTSEATISEGTIEEHSWNLGESPVLVSGETVTNEYNSDGTYTINYVATSNNNCVSTLEQEITIHPTPEANFSFTTACLNQEETEFSDLSSITSGSIVSWEWDFGDGNSSSSQNISHSYGSVNIFNASLMVTSDMGCENTINKPVEVLSSPTGAILSTLQEDCDRLCTDLSFESMDNIVSYDWVVSNQYTFAIENPIFCIDNEGTYDVSLKVTNDNGCVLELEELAYFNVFPSAEAGFSIVDPVLEILNPTTQFIDQSINAIQWNWYVSDQTSSVEQSPVYSFSDTGEYVVLQVVRTENGCVDSLSKTLQVNDVFNVFIPNTFIPNGDLKNDIFNLKASGYKEEGFVLRIFNRWGEEIFVTEDILEGWNGILSNNQIAKQDVYVYDIEIYDKLNRMHPFKGHFNLLR